MIGTSTSHLYMQLNNELSTPNSADGLIKEFVRVKNGFEPLLFITFVSQTTLITTNIYIAISGNVYYTISIVYEMLELAYIAYILEDCYTSFKSLALRLQKNAIQQEFNETKLMISIIEAESPFTAFGLFNVQRSTLTNIFGTSLTYLVILCQFK